MDLFNLTLKQAIDLIQKNEVSSKQLAEHYLDAVAKDNERSDKLNALFYLDKKKILAEAEKVNKNGLLAGCPIAIKDNMHVVNQEIGCCSNILEGNVSTYTSGACRRLLKNGALLFGRTNMDEFAFGSSNETSQRGVVRNPRHRDYVPGGSSGGSAAAVGGDLVLSAIGSDTGGSIRQPASFCGVVGLKPSYGRVSRYGLVAFASSLDQIGPITKTVEDSAILLKALAGHDEADATSSKHPVDDYPAHLSHSLKGKRIALMKSSYSDVVDKSVKTSIEGVVDYYQKAGAQIDVVDIASNDYAVAIYYIIATAEASSNLSRYDGIRYGRRHENAIDIDEVYKKSRSEGFGMEVKRRILMGTYVLSSGYYDAYYGKAQRLRSWMQKEYFDILDKYDAILTPVTPEKVFKLGSKLDDPIKMYFSDAFTISANLVGVPSLCIPCGKDENGLPLSFQLIGKNFDEKTILNLGHIYQTENDWETKEVKN